jgi:hypothetical protein
MSPSAARRALEKQRGVVQFAPPAGGTLSTVTLLETGKTFGTNNREQERPNLE